MNKVNVKRFLPNDKDVNPKDITDMENLQYLVRSSNSEENYFVDMHICRCSCPQGFNGKICKHQSAVIKKFNINFACNILSEEQKRTLYTIATGKKPSDHLLMPLLLSSDEILPDKSTIINEKATDVPSTSVSNMDTDNNESHKENCEDQIVSQWKTFIEEFNATVLTNVRDDPENFKEGVKTFIKNWKKNMTSSSSLLSGLYTAFKPSSAGRRRFRTTRKGIKISVQPTTIARRKTKFTGRRRFQSGRKPNNNHKGSLLAPHNLQNCVAQNKGLGSRKIAK